MCDVKAFTWARLDTVGCGVPSCMHGLVATKKEMVDDMKGGSRFYLKVDSWPSTTMHRPQQIRCRMAHDNAQGLGT